MNKNNKETVKIIPLGGLEQIGMNITAIEYEDSIIVIDCGLAFPEDDMIWLFRMSRISRKTRTRSGDLWLPMDMRITLVPYLTLRKN